MDHKPSESACIHQMDPMDSYGCTGEHGLTSLSPQFLEVMSEVVVFISETVERSIEAERSSRAKGLVKKMLTGRWRGAPEAKGSAPLPPLGPDQLRRAYQLALEKAQQLNLSEEQARRLADAVMGRPDSYRDGSCLAA